MAARENRPTGPPLLDAEDLRRVFIPGTVERVNAKTLSTADAPVKSSRFRLLLAQAKKYADAGESDRR
jgi:hypothetical protein